MLEGLEASEIMFSYVKSQSDILRLDSYYYSKEFLSDEIIISKTTNKTLKELNASLLSFGAYSLNNFVEYKDSGIPFIRGVNMKNGILDFSDTIYIDEEAHKLLWKSEVKPNTVLLSMSGTIGDVAIAVQEYDYPMNSNQDIAKIRLKEEGIRPCYLYAFLRSKYGQNFLKREARGSVQQHVFLSQIETIRIPLLTDSFQLQIEQLVKSAHSNLHESKALYSDAENMLLSEIGLKGWQPNSNPINIKQLKESFLASGRLDAEYYQSKYEDYSDFIKHYKGGSDSLKYICSVNDKNFNPSGDSEYKYIELSNIGNSGEITGCTNSIGSELPSRARRLVHTNDVIVSSIEGSLQSVALVTEEYDKAICSTGFYVVNSKTINPETLLVLFKSEPMQNLLKQGCSGTILTAIGRTEFQNLVMPKIRKEVQTEIAEYVQKSISLRNEAKQLLESAKLKVEDIISTPPHLIDNQLITKHNRMIEESAYYYRLAEWTLLQELYSEIWVTDTTVNYSIKNYSVCKASGRLDAEYYQPKYDALFAQLSKHECDTIKDIAHIKKSVEPGSEAYRDEGIPFVRVSDVTKLGISDTSIFLSPNDFDLQALQPKKDTILLSKDGSVGIAYKVEKDLDCITSGALLHLSVFNEDYNPDYLTLVLNSIVVQMQAERDSNGAIIQHWKPSEIEQVIIPKLPKPIQDTISAKIQESFALKNESKRLLDEAKMMVEREVEKGGILCHKKD